MCPTQLAFPLDRITSVFAYREALLDLLKLES
jgi:hypothetical protein